MSDTASGSGRLRATWEVEAGIIPGQAMPEHTKRWHLTSETFYEENQLTEEEFKRRFPDGITTYLRYRNEAFEYAKSLQDPRSLNWVEVTWLWY